MKVNDTIGGESAGKSKIGVMQRRNLFTLEKYSNPFRTWHLPCIFQKKPESLSHCIPPHVSNPMRTQLQHHTVRGSLLIDSPTQGFESWLKSYFRIPSAKNGQILAWMGLSFALAMAAGTVPCSPLRPELREGCESRNDTLSSECCSQGQWPGRAAPRVNQTGGQVTKASRVKCHVTGHDQEGRQEGFAEGPNWVS